MAITLALQTPGGDFFETPYVLLDEELAGYFETLSRFTAMRSLAKLDPYGESKLQSSLCEKLVIESRYLESLASKKRLPAPPEFVGLEGTGDPEVGEPFGWEGLVAFARDLREVLLAASSKRAEVVAIGD